MKIVLSIAEGKTSSLFKEDEVPMFANSRAFRDDIKSILWEEILKGYDKLVRHLW